MAARLLFLGKLADLAGKTEDELAFSAPLDWADVLGWIEEWFPAQLHSAIAGATVKVALNGMVLADREGLEFRDGDELAFLPPVSGG